MTDAYLCGFARTPIGRYGGALAGMRTDDLAAHPIRVLKERHGSVDWGAVDEVMLGCANQAGEDNRNVARMAALPPACRRRCRAARSTGSAARASTRSAARPGRSGRARRT